MEPVCPASDRPPERTSCIPSPYAWSQDSAAGATAGTRIRARPSAPSTRSSPAARNAAKRHRSPAVDHNCPAGAISPVSASGSGSTASAHGCTAHPRAYGSRGSGVVRSMPSGSSTSSRSTSYQGAPRSRSTREPSSA